MEEVDFYTEDFMPEEIVSNTSIEDLDLANLPLLKGGYDE